MINHYETIKALLFNERLSISEVKERLSGQLSPMYIRKICHEVLHTARTETGIEYRPSKRRPGGFRPLKSTDPLSQIHLAVGVRMNHHRVIKHDLSPREFCSRYQFSNLIRLRQMELGQYDFTLSELQQVATILNISTEELVKPFTQNVYAA